MQRSAGAIELSGSLFQSFKPESPNLCSALNLCGPPLRDFMWAILKDFDRITDLDWCRTDSGRNTDLKLPRVDGTGARLLPFAPYEPFRGH